MFRLSRWPRQDRGLGGQKRASINLPLTNPTNLISSALNLKPPIILQTQRVAYGLAIMKPHFLQERWGFVFCD